MIDFEKNNCSFLCVKLQMSRWPVAFPLLLFLHTKEDSGKTKRINKAERGLSLCLLIMCVGGRDNKSFTQEKKALQSGLEREAFEGGTPSDPSVCKWCVCAITGNV